MSPAGSGFPASRSDRFRRHLKASGAVAAGALVLAACGTATNRTAATRAAGRSAASPSPAAGPYGRSLLQRDTDAITRSGVTGTQVRVIRDGRNLVATSGVGDVRNRRPVRPDDHFRIASSTKTFVATVVLQLAGEGRLSLDDTVERRLPGVVRGNGNDGRKITVHELLQHMSGIHDSFTEPETAEGYYRHRFDVVPPEALVAAAMRHRPDFAPGTGWNYSNTGYILLGMIIKRVTGRPWYKEVDRRIVRPLGLRDTSWPGLSPDLPGPHAEGYNRFRNDALVDVTRHREAYPVSSAGALISTTADLDRFYRALLGGRLLRPAQLAEMKRTVPGNAEMEKMFPGARYGLGLLSVPLSCGGRYWGHGGDIIGFKTRDGFTEDGRRGVVVSMSTQQGMRDRQDKAVAALIDHALCEPG